MKRSGRKSSKGSTKGAKSSKHSSKIFSGPLAPSTKSTEAAVMRAKRGVFKAAEKTPFTPTMKRLYQAALKARRNAHAPYSRCQVGAAILLKNGKIYGGCNMENSSYGATVCAERGALQNAVIHEGPIQVREILVVTDSNPPWMPCGLCRQVIAEFGTNIVIHATNLDGHVTTLNFGDLYPGGFTPEELFSAQEELKVEPQAPRPPSRAR